ncbi:hypothetical protein LguiA_031434 [Lonicera macranthoides]
MDETVSHEGQKRRLPPWMLGVAAVESKGKEVTDIVIKEKKGVGSRSLQANSRAIRTARIEKEVPISRKVDSDLDGSSLLAKCELKRTKRKVIKQEVKCDGNTQEGKYDLQVGEPSLVVKCESKRTKRKVGRQEEASHIGDTGEAAFEKREYGEVGRTVKESASRKRRKTKRSGFESDEEIEGPSSNEDDGDLTMEDLMSIAKEFVKDDNGEGKQQPLDGERQVETQFADSASSRYETTSRHSSAETLTSEGVIVNPRMTGDPAQDMLDLFLGPLLKNPLEKDDKKVELIDMRFAHESEKLKENDVCGAEPVPLLKKKRSSLRDKVAAFLD